MLTSLFRIARLTQLFFIEMSTQCLHKTILQVHWKNPVSGDESKADVSLEYLNLERTTLQSINDGNL